MLKPSPPQSTWSRVYNWLDAWFFGTKGPERPGGSAEDAAAHHLQDHGYRIIARNHRTRLGELDIIARQGDMLVIVEVKSGQQASAFRPHEHVDRAKRRRLLQLAEDYRKRQRLLHLPVRLDIIEVIERPGQRPQINHLQAAIRDER